VFGLWIIYKKKNKTPNEEIIIDSLLESKACNYYSVLQGTVKNIRVSGNINIFPKVVYKGKIRNKIEIVKIKIKYCIIKLNKKKIIIYETFLNSKELILKIKEAIETTMI